MNISNLWIFRQIMKELEVLKKEKSYFTSPKDFTRNCVFTFKTVFFLIADLPRKSLSIEVDHNLAIINALLSKKRLELKVVFVKLERR